MRKFTVLLVALALLILPARAQAATITISTLGFVPAAMTINQNDTVTWTNTDTADHQVVGDKAGLTSTVLHTGESFSFVFKKAGTFQIKDALDKSFRGTVVVKATPTPKPAPTPAGAVTIAASKLQLVYGTSTTLSGTLSNKQSGQQVEVLAQAYGENAYKSLATVTTGGGGSWSYVAKTRIRTSYEARSGHTTSSAVTVGVRPLVTLHVLSGNRFSTKVVAARSFVGRLVQLQRHSSYGQWVTVKRMRLNASSAAIFHPVLPTGTSKLRMSFSVNQAGPGYLGGFSRSIFFQQT
jgi:plastocyanin